MTSRNAPQPKQQVAENATERLPYRKPGLRRLGSVRELTLGGTMGMSEGGGTFMPAGGD